MVSKLTLIVTNTFSSIPGLFDTPFRRSLACSSARTAADTELGVLASLVVHARRFVCWVRTLLQLPSNAYHASRYVEAAVFLRCLAESACDVTMRWHTGRLGELELEVWSIRSLPKAVRKSDKTVAFHEVDAVPCLTPSFTEHRTRR